MGILSGLREAVKSDTRKAIERSNANAASGSSNTVPAPQITRKTPPTSGNKQSILPAVNTYRAAVEKEKHRAEMYSDI